MTDQDAAESESGDRFKTIVAVLIALVTTLSAVVAWRTALASDTASTADFVGLTASLQAEDTRASDYATMYANYRAYTDYVHHYKLGEAIQEQIDATPEADTPELRHQMNETYALAINDNDFFPGRYLERDLSYDKQRDLGEAWAEAAMKKDINPEPHFSLADSARSKTSWLVVVIIILSAALWFYTLAQSIDHPLKYVMALGGTGFLLIGGIATFAIEWTR
jgi:hypothetical protein